MISNQIITAMYEFKNKTLDAPKAIYLGHATRLALLAERGIQRYIDHEGEKEGYRMKFSGVRVYIVDEEHHLAIG